MFFKFFWIIRAIIYKLFFKKIAFPSYIGKPCFIKNSKNISLGKKVRIFPGVRMETHQGGKILIEDDVSIGQNFHITSASNLIIKTKTTILGNVFITNIDHEYQKLGKHIMQQKFLIKETIIGENCFIGYGACIQAGTILGKQCIVGANSVVRGIFPDYSVIVGSPGKIIKKYNNNLKAWQRIKNEV